VKVAIDALMFEVFKDFFQNSVETNTIVETNIIVEFAGKIRFTRKSFISFKSRDKYFFSFLGVPETENLISMLSPKKIMNISAGNLFLLFVAVFLNCWF